MFSEREEKILLSNLKIIASLGDDRDRLAYIIYRLMEGDEADGAEALAEMGYTDENGEWIYDEDEEDEVE